MTNFGASGDVVQFSVNTVSNSTIVSVAGTNTFSSADVGKVIEVFRAGPQLQFSNDPPYVTIPFYGSHPNNGTVVTQQDIICLITNVTEGTNLWMPIACGYTMTNAYCIVGMNNAPAFQAAINEASNIVATSEYTNVTINIPAGTYLMVSSNVLNPNYVMSSIFNTQPAITISSGGITLLGQSATNTILMGCGAGMEHILNSTSPYGSPGFFDVQRDTLMVCTGPVQNGQYPLVFNNLTFDGGLTNGAQAYNYWTLEEGNGDGWDTTHHAVADSDPLVTHQMNQMKVFTNCVFQHWRGEVLICWTGDITNGFNDIANCTFYDGNGTADNMYYGQHVHGCVFNQMGKVMEYYQANASLPSVFEDNLWTNIAPNNNYALTIIGATTNTTPPAFTIQNNVFHSETGINAVQFSPAANVSVVSNIFIGGGSGLVFTYAGVQPSDGSAIPCMTKFLVADNTFQCGWAIVDLGYPINNMMISNNTGFCMKISAVYAANIVLANNSGIALASDYDVMGGMVTLGNLSSGITGGQYMIDETNNNWPTPFTYSPDGGQYYQTNIVSYGNGCIHKLQNSGATFYLDDIYSNLIPAGATLQVYAQTQSKDNITNFYTSATSPGLPMTITNNAPPITFQWNGSHWVPVFGGAETNNSSSATPTVQITATPINGLAPLAVQFSAPNVDSVGNTIKSWNWNFGDGSTSSAQNPSHIYTTAGTFYPALTATNVLGAPVFGLGPAIVVTSPAVASTNYNSVIVVKPPSLALIPSSPYLLLTWPTNAIGYTLQYATNLSPPVSWVAVSSKPVVLNGENIVVSSMLAAQMFFRLYQ